MEPVGWVSCGCGKGVTIYARKQQAKQTVEKVAEALGDEKGQPWKLERHMQHKAFKAEAAAAAKAQGQQRLCARCGKPFAGPKHLKYCTYDCYLENLATKAVATADLEPPTAVQAAWQTSEEETKELLEKLES